MGAYDPGYVFQEGGPAAGPAADPAAAAGGRAAAIAEPLGGWQQLGARTPARPRERLIAMFRAPANVAYLRGLFARRVPPGPLRAFALATLEDSVYAFEQIEDLAYSDPVAQRGGARPAVSFWAEVRRINRAFYEYRMQFLRDKAALLEGRSADGEWDADESYHMQMFTADSLRPPGLERLNSDGPLYALLEDQTSGPPPPGKGRPRARGRAEGFASTLGAARRTAAGARGPPDPLDPGVSADDWAWDGGDPDRTPEQALAEYWGEESAESSVLASTEAGGEAYVDSSGQGAQWRENGGTRFMRYPTIPIWQNLSRGRNYDRDIEETLGTGERESANHIRGWDMSRMREPRGEEYRRYGARSGDMV